MNWLIFSNQLGCLHCIVQMSARYFNTHLVHEGGGQMGAHLIYNYQFKAQN